ncbi:TetR/AcrR family transcriptional regulator [Euzebya sp.]|uniref:TetR/AcrR family transcriptional regulator n=1 Tax=Euzebya sp. TaxID=1971409 RepID=UPI003515A3E9
MAPAKTSRAARTRERLRAAAREAFDELGWQGTRVQDIAERAGVSHGTFYTYYENRNAVLVDLVTDTMAAFIELVSQPWEGEDVKTALQKVIGGFLDTYEGDAPVMHTWMQASREDPEFGALYLDLRQRFVDRITEQVEGVLLVSGRRGQVPPPASIAAALAAMVEHFAYCHFVLGDAYDRESALDSLVLVWGSTINSLAGFDVMDLTALGDAHRT